MFTEQQDSHNGFLTQPFKSDNLVQDLDSLSSTLDTKNLEIRMNTEKL